MSPYSFINWLHRVRGALAVSIFLSITVLCPAAHAGPTDARQQEILHLLRHDCGSCHGMTLKGGLGPALLPESLSGKPDELLKNTILDGRPPTPMPPWRGILTEDEVEWLIGRLREGISQ